MREESTFIMYGHGQSKVIVRFYYVLLNHRLKKCIPKHFVSNIEIFDKKSNNSVRMNYRIKCVQMIVEFT